MPVWELIEFNSWQKYSTRFSTYIFSKRKELFSLISSFMLFVQHFPRNLRRYFFVQSIYSRIYIHIYIAFNTKNTKRSEYHEKCSSFEQYRHARRQIVHRIPRGKRRFLHSRIFSLFQGYLAYNHHNAFNVKRWRRSDTWVWPGLWIYGKWQRLETVHGDRFGRQFVSEIWYTRQLLV